MASLKGEQGQQGIQGLQGEKGDKGDKGDQGITGETGTGVSKVEIIEDKLVITLSDDTVINLGNVKGAKGDKGDKGDTGADGNDGVGISAVVIDTDGHLKITLTTGVTTDLGNVKGADGQDGVGIDEIYIQDGNLYVKKTTDTTAVNLGSVKGEKGDKGDKGDTGPQGPQGPAGNDGVDGKSAYDMAVKNGFEGSETEWLASLAGRGIVKTEISGTNFIVYYTDSTSETHDLSDMFGDPNEKEVLAYILLDDGTYGVKADGIAKYEVTTIKIPETYNGVAVTQILAEGFKDLTLLQTIVLNDNITVIGANAFYNCASLTSISIPETVTEIGNSAFYDCRSLSNIILPSQITSIGQGTFYNCVSLTTISIPENVKSIGVKAFSQSGLTTVEISGTWTYSVKNITGQVTSSDAGPYAQTYTAESMTFTWNCANNINNAKYLNGSSALSVYQRYGGYEYQFSALPANYELKKK